MITSIVTKTEVIANVEKCLQAALAASLSGVAFVIRLKKLCKGPSETADHFASLCYCLAALAIISLAFEKEPKPL